MDLNLYFLYLNFLKYLDILYINYIFSFYYSVYILFKYIIICNFILHKDRNGEQR